MEQPEIIDGTHIVRTGSGPTLVLVHGVGLDHTMWNLVVDELSEHRTVVRYDLLGHGKSANPSGPRSVGDFVGQLLQVVDAVSDGSPVDIAGLSLGGLIVRSAAVSAAGADFRSVSILNAVYARPEHEKDRTRHRLALTEAEGMGAVADLAIDRWFTKDWQAAHGDRAEAVKSTLLANDLDGYLKAYRVFIDGDPHGEEHLHSIQCRALVQTGEFDVGSTPAMTHDMAKAIPGATAQILHNLRHLPPIEDPERFTLALLSFLEDS